MKEDEVCPLTKEELIKRLLLFAVILTHDREFEVKSNYSCGWYDPGGSIDYFVGDYDYEIRIK